MISMRANLQAARRAKGLTQEQVAKILDVGLRHYKKIEAGDTLGSILIWDTLEDLLGVNQRVLREIHLDKGDNR